MSDPERDIAVEWLRECVEIHRAAESSDLPGVEYALRTVMADPLARLVLTLTEARKVRTAWLDEDLAALYKPGEKP